MTRLTDGQSSSSHRPLPETSQNNRVLRPEVLARLPLPEAPAQRTLDRDHVSNDQVGTQEHPTHVARGLPGSGEPEGQSDGEATNRLMHRIAILEATRDDISRGVERGPSSSTARGLPPGALTLNGDGSITTPGGYTVLNDGGHNWRIREPSGREHRIWGDPHVDENNDGKDDWHFNRDATFILPDGSKISCNTSKVSQYGGAAVTVSDELHVQYGDSLGRMDVRNGGPGTVGGGGNHFDHVRSDGQVFVLADDSRFVAGHTLGDLYDRGGDFAADISLGNRGSISEAARFTLGLSRETGPSRSSREWREEASHGAVQLPTLTDMVTGTYQRTDARRVAHDEEAGEDLTAQQLRGKVRGVGST